MSNIYHILNAGTTNFGRIQKVLEIVKNLKILLNFNEM